MKQTLKSSLALLLLLLCTLCSCAFPGITTTQPPMENVHPEGIPGFTSQPYAVINDNQPSFTEDDYTTTSFERYAELDSLGRCGVAYACIGKDLMPTEERGSIGMVKPSGWQTVKYDIVNGKYLYNRCHLIGFQLTGENANKSNLITGTRYLNVDAMLPFENMVADYIKETENHVLYRITPFFLGNNLVASGVYMEAYSVEDKGEGICFSVYCYNAQPGIVIDYSNGNSRLATDSEWSDPIVTTTPNGPVDPNAIEYVLNTNSMKFHLLTCSGADKIAEHNRDSFTGNRQTLIDQGYSPCGICKP